jgi:outer membrane protein TolC
MRKKMKRIILSVIILSTSFVKTSAVKAQEILTVEEAIEEALRSNFDIQLVRLDSTAFAIDNSYAYAGFIPRLNASGIRTWNTNSSDIEFSDGRKVERSGVRTNNLNASVNLNWTLFDGLRMFATLQKLSEFQKLGEYVVKEQIVNTVAAVINNYFDIVRQKQQLKAIEEQMSINNERVELADKKLSVGLGAKPELLQAKVDLNAQRSAQLTQQSLIVQLKEQLNQLMGKPISVEYEVTDSIPINPNLQYEALRSNLEISNPSLMVASKNISVARLSLKEARADLFPTVTFNSAYVFGKTINSTIVNPNNPILFNQNTGFNYGLSLSVPILNGLNTRRLIRQGELTVKMQELNYQNQLSQLDVSLSNSYKNYLLQKQTLQLEEENLGLARENVSIALARFRLGVSTYLELREAQISLEQAYNRLIAARYNTKVSETELLRLRGSLVY